MSLLAWQITWREIFWSWLKHISCNRVWFALSSITNFRNIDEVKYLKSWYLDSEILSNIVWKNCKKINYHFRNLYILQVHYLFNTFSLQIKKKVLLLFSQRYDWKNFFFFFEELQLLRNFWHVLMIQTFLIPKIASYQTLKRSYDAGYNPQPFFIKKLDSIYLSNNQVFILSLNHIEIFR